jgi:endoplasmic reticulum-Golgi intermediate compartment protein 3
MRRIRRKEDDMEKTETMRSSISLSRQIRRFDVYPKLEDDYRVKTSSGAALSVIMAIVILVLVTSETFHYWRPKAVDIIEVDGTVDERMMIDMKITFFELPCSKVNLVAMDVAGEHQIHADSNYHMHKTRISKDETILGNKMKISVNRATRERELGLEPLPKDYCGSCYGAKDGCCNTCEELKEAYTAKGWAWKAISGEKSEQCKRDALLSPEISKEGRNEGCVLEGTMKVNKVAGNFHIALGTTRSVDGRLVHAFNVKEMQHFNTSHRIDRVSFGQNFVSQSNPLSGKVRTVDYHNADTGVFQYYIKVVPTNFQMFGLTYRSAEYSFTEKFVPIGEGHDDEEDKNQEEDHLRRNGHKNPHVIKALPGVFFIYDISPFQIHRTMESMSFTEYFARLCAIVGGVYTVSGFVDSLICSVGGRDRR